MNRIHALALIFVTIILCLPGLAQEPAKPAKPTGKGITEPLGFVLRQAEALDLVKPEIVNGVEYTKYAPGAILIPAKDRVIVTYTLVTLNDKGEPVAAYGRAFPLGTEASLALTTSWFGKDLNEKAMAAFLQAKVAEAKQKKHDGVP